MKAIETQFKGILYRSRTEARWAVFMDALKFPFVYEPEGFDLKQDGWYIPDFWLPSIETFMEIKPEIMVHGRGSPTSALCKSTKKNVITFFGMPELPEYNEPQGAGTLDIWSDGYYGQDCDYWFCCCPTCKRVGIEFNGRSDRIGCSCKKSCHGDKGYNHDDEFLLNAYYKARNSFRFKRN